MKHSKIKGPAFRADSPTAGSQGILTLEQAARPSLVMEEKGILYGQGGWAVAIKIQLCKSCSSISITFCWLKKLLRPA